MDVDFASSRSLVAETETTEALPSMDVYRTS
jgi:hypothetical protein